MVNGCWWLKGNQQTQGVVTTLSKARCRTALSFERVLLSLGASSVLRNVTQCPRTVVLNGRAWDTCVHKFLRTCVHGICTLNPTWGWREFMICTLRRGIRMIISNKVGVWGRREMHENFNWSTGMKSRLSRSKRRKDIIKINVKDVWCDVADWISLS